MRWAASFPSSTCVKLDPNLPQRQVDLRREDQDGQPFRQSDAAVEETQSDAHRHDGGAERGDQLEDQRGKEGNAKHPHRRLAILVGDLAEDRDLGPSTAENPQGRQSLEDVQKVTAQPAEKLPLPLGSSLGFQADQNHKDRDQRDGDREDDRREGSRRNTQMTSASGARQPRTSCGRYRAK